MPPDRDPLAGLLSAATVAPAVLSGSSLNPAKWAHERIVRSINRFEEDLDDQHEVGARLVTFGPAILIQVEDVGYWGPDIVIFYGIDEGGQKVQLLQHVSQLSVLLVAVKKAHDKPRRIGFQLMEGLSEKKS